MTNTVPCFAISTFGLLLSAFFYTSSNTLEIKASMLFNLDFANNIYFSCKKEMETHVVTVETNYSI